MSWCCVALCRVELSFTDMNETNLQHVFRICPVELSWVVSVDMYSALMSQIWDELYAACKSSRSYVVGDVEPKVSTLGCSPCDKVVLWSEIKQIQKWSKNDIQVFSHTKVCSHQVRGVDRGGSPGQDPPVMQQGGLPMDGPTHLSDQKWLLFLVVRCIRCGRISRRCSRFLNVQSRY
jgi:hypothetical protein